jgi:glycosyltransferase involved in cell wall biosynthesis
MALVERRTLPLVDHVFVVVEESARRLRERLGLPAARVSVVSNTPRLEQFAAAAAPATPGRQLPLRLVYAGLVQEARGLEDVIEAIALLRARGTRMRFKVIGSGPYLASLARLVEDRSLQDLVELTGWVAHADLARHVRAADAGVIPHPRNAHTDTTVPNKLFDYMACGLPVVVSNAAPLERIVTAESCGFVFSAGDPQSLVAVLERVAASRAVLATLGQNGARAVKSRYHWERDAAFLVDAVARFASAAPGAQPRLEGH